MALQYRGETEEDEALDQENFGGMKLFGESQFSVKAKLLLFSGEEVQGKQLNLQGLKGQCNVPDDDTSQAV